MKIKESLERIYFSTGFYIEQTQGYYLAEENTLVVVSLKHLSKMVAYLRKSRNVQFLKIDCRYLT